MNITLDDTSPQFRYFSSGNTWIANHTTDPSTDLYFKKTFMGTHTEADYVSLTFNGTAITIYGAKRPNHGVYSTQLDGGSESFQSGYSSTSQFQVPIFQAMSLSEDLEHTILLKNLPSQTTVSGTNNTEWWMDVDYAVITTSATGKVWTTTYDDQSPALNYIGSGWDPYAAPLQPADYFNRTAHVTQTVGDSVSLSFNGSSVQVFGGLYFDHGNFSVSLDGGKTSNYNGTFFELQPGTTLYQATGLEEGVHNIQITNLGQGRKGKFLDIDYFVVNSTVDHSSSDNSTDGNSTSTSTAVPLSGKSSSNAGAIAGGVVGGILGLALVVVLAWFLFRRNRTKLGGEESPYLKPGKLDFPMDLNGTEVKPYISNQQEHHILPIGALPVHNDPPTSSYNGHVRELSSNTTTGHSVHQLSPTGRDTNARGSFLNVVPGPPPSNATSYARSINPPSSIGSPPPIPEGYTNPFNTPREQGMARSEGAQTFGVGGGTSDDGHSRGSGKSAGVPLPYTARLPSSRSPTSVNTATASIPPVPASHQASSPGADISNPHGEGDGLRSQGSIGRMYVPGRAQDVGPFGAGAEVEPEVAAVLPPDYNQATEPLPGQRARK
ncbi:hypothetical protein L198_02082 [Cryptococcus wingfieldii CBS 7118]|uniref:Transmembrane protein n=1 Tax=Cryptococcus wingfieldii CBS 7118 TaxID=1295528 RepID=A0A1E3JX09_9TREE|nr:hypothetical protein L198_02082 [Cryptococcus wingfieldii CBS 7118]ODO05389.1 hypothetical protein L198_02082 [Cryptococcus wingfieldii CBS 7118]